MSRIVVKIFLIYFLQSLFILFEAKYSIPDQVILSTIIYREYNLTIYTSLSNPSREPKSWIFWYDPLIIFDYTKDIYQYNDQIRFTFSISSPQIDQTIRENLIKTMHPDVEHYAIFWVIEPLPIDTLTIYIIDETSLPISSVYPCIKNELFGTLTFECQFQCSSIIIANSIKDSILCGKLKLELKSYIQSSTYPIIIPSRITTRKNWNYLRLNFNKKKYISRFEKSKFIEKYFVNIQTIDNTIKEIDLEILFQLAINQTTYYEMNYFNGLWIFEDFEYILNNDLFYKNYQLNNQILFYLKTNSSSSILKYFPKQIYSIDEIKEIFLNKFDISIEWLFNEQKWIIKSLKVYFLSDLYDYLQLSLINKQYYLDILNTKLNQTIDCSYWSTICSCQSTISSIVFLSTTQFIRISNIDMDLELTGFTIELWLRPDLLPPNGIESINILNFRDQYQLTYESNGEIKFRVMNKIYSNIYVRTLQSINVNQWIFLSFVYSSIDNQLEFYLNGQFISSIILIIKPEKLTNDILIGKEFIGAIRDLRLWNCSRNQYEIFSTMKTNSLIGNETCLIGLWSMTDNYGQIIKDLTMNNIPHHGTLGFDHNLNLITDPIWAYVLPKSFLPPPPKARTLTYSIFRENITSPMYVQWGTIFDIPVPADYDGDGLADFAVYRPTTMTWMISSSNNPNILLTKSWGLPGDIPVRCNFDGDRYFDYTIFRPSTSQWISHLSSNPSYQYIHKWGKSNDIPCPGDFDGDGKTDFVVYRRGVFYISPSNDPSVQWTKQWGQPGDIPLSNCDFDGDGKSDFAVWTPSSAIWSWIPSGNSSLIYQRQWGSIYDTPLCEDFDGDGKGDFIVYRNWTGEWFIIPYSVSSVIITYQWGRSTDVPFAGDFDGDGRADFGLWRPRINKSYVWEIIPSSMPVALLRKPWGIAGDAPVSGDFDDDRRSDITIWRSSNGFWYTIMIGKPGIQEIKHWGFFTANDTAVTADWNGDIFSDYTIFRPSNCYWYITLQDNPILRIFMQWGVPEYQDFAVAGDYDGDGKYDFAVWRPSTGIWFILPSTNPSHIVMSQWGIPGDVPITAADFDGDGKSDIAVWRPSTGSWYILPSSNPIYPFFGPSVIRQPLQPLPKPQSVPLPNTKIPVWPPTTKKMIPA
ncbi:unnamed protein product [Adineta steineri]|uniref:Uncharacterized protein n=1 Tax=Adineta steineri TaxID=433720 RepID=A0A814HPV3_9BILA|nr:unnamed protein product [Adineta steineri]CAF1051620.1 unnamed protein product [Adineta steineri]